MVAEPALRIAITGATGFVGGRLVPAMLARGWRVKALCRRPPPPGFWSQWPELALGDLADRESLAALVADVDVVVHLAGAIKARNRQGFFEVNEAGVERLATSLGSARLILVSSLAAREPTLSDYAASKRAGEEAASRICEGSLTILRPPAIYGPGDRETLPLFRLAAFSPVAPRLGPAQGRVALCHVDEVVHALCALAAQPLNGLFALGGSRPDGFAWDEILRTASATFGRSAAVVGVPPAGLAIAAGVASAVAGLTGRAAIFTPGKVREMQHQDWSVPPAEALPLSHVGPTIPLAEGFAGTAKWYREHGWLRSKH